MRKEWTAAAATPSCERAAASGPAAGSGSGGPPGRPLSGWPTLLSIQFFQNLSNSLEIFFQIKLPSFSTNFKEIQTCSKSCIFLTTFYPSSAVSAPTCASKYSSCNLHSNLGGCREPLRAASLVDLQGIQEEDGDAVVQEFRPRRVVVAVGLNVFSLTKCEHCVLKYTLL